MANWTGAARTNYVKVKDMDALQASVAPWEMDMREDETATLVAFFGSRDDGDFQSWGVTDDTGDDIEFDWAEHVMLEIITGERGLMTHMLPRAARAVEPWLREHVTDPRFWDGEYDTAPKTRTVFGLW